MDYVENLQMIETWVNEWKLTGHKSLVHGGLMVEAWPDVGNTLARIRVEPSGEEWKITKCVPVPGCSFPDALYFQESTESCACLEEALEQASEFLRNHGT